MEIMYLGGLALAGYVLSKPNKRKVLTEVPSMEHYSEKPVTPVREEPRSPVREEPRIPVRLPVQREEPTIQELSSNKPTPFYKRQPYNTPDHTSRMLDQHGGDPTFYRSKKEIGSFTKMDETIKSRAFNKPMLNKQQFENVLTDQKKYQSVPLQEPIRVGPGLNDPTSQARGGFHDFYRQMPRDFAITQRELPAKANHGASQVESRPLLQEMTVKDHKRFATIEERPMERGKHVADGHAIRSVVPERCTNRGYHSGSVEELTGTKTAVDSRQAPLGQNTQTATNRSIDNCGISLGPTNTTGGWVATKAILQQTQRGKECDSTNTAARQLASYGPRSRIQDKYKTTLRELSSCNTAGNTAIVGIYNNGTQTRPEVQKFDKGLHKQYAGPSGRMNKLDDALSAIGNTTQEKTDDNKNRGGILKAMGTQNFPAPVGGTRDSIKITAQRTLDLNIAKEQLKDNALHLAINYDG